MITNWCGCPMKRLGYGLFPYACRTQDRYPTAAIYVSDCEHSRGSAWAADTSDCGDLLTMNADEARKQLRQILARLPERCNLAYTWR